MDHSRKTKEANLSDILVNMSKLEKQIDQLKYLRYLHETDIVILKHEIKVLRSILARHGIGVIEELSDLYENTNTK